MCECTLHFLHITRLLLFLLNLLPLWSSNFPSNFMACMFFATNRKKVALSWNTEEFLLIYSTFHLILLIYLSILSKLRLHNLIPATITKIINSCLSFKGTHVHNQTCSDLLTLDRKYFVCNYWNTWNSLKKFLSCFIQIYSCKDNWKLIMKILFCLQSLSRVRGCSLF